MEVSRRFYGVLDDEAPELQRARMQREFLDEYLRDNMRRNCCESSCAVCKAFRALSHRLLDEDCTVAFMVNKISPGGWFEPPGMIHVARSDLQVNADGTMAELAYVAHEAGHRKSLHGEKRDPSFTALKEKLAKPNTHASASEQLVLIEEEELAWKLGRAMLNEVSPELHEEFWQEFARVRERCIATYYASTRDAVTHEESTGGHQGTQQPKSMRDHLASR